MYGLAVFEMKNIRFEASSTNSLKIHQKSVSSNVLLEYFLYVIYASYYFYYSGFKVYYER